MRSPKFQINRWKGCSTRRRAGPCSAFLAPLSPFSQAAVLLLKSELDYTESIRGTARRPSIRDYYALCLITIPNMNANCPQASRVGIYMSQLPVDVSLGLLISSVRGRIVAEGGSSSRLAKGCEDPHGVSALSPLERIANKNRSDV